MAFTCEICGVEHDDWPPDIAFQRPDEIWAMSPEERQSCVRESNDLCILADERYFIRGILYLNLPEHRKAWGLGLWVEVAKKSFDRYYELYDADASLEPSFTGRIANALKAFPQAYGSEVEVRLGTSSQRPVLVYPAGAATDLAAAQVSGLGNAALHAVVRIERPAWLAAMGT